MYLDDELIDYNVYSYTNAVFHKQGLGFRGFEQIRTIDSRGQVSTQTYAPYNYCVLLGKETPTAKKEFSYSTSVLSNKIVRIRLMHKEETNKLTGLHNSTDYTYDEYGYPKTENVQYSDNINIKTKYAYNESTDLSKLYMIGILKKQSQQRLMERHLLIEPLFQYGATIDQ